MTLSPRRIRCAIYTRKSHEEGLELEFNSLDAQRDAAESYIASQRHEGWHCLATRYDDGGFSGGTMERPALAALMADIEAGLVDCVVVYKVDRLSRSLLDFSRLIALFDEHDVSFVSVTQQFNTTTSMGRLTLNILLSFAQFEREIIGERIRDKKLLTARQGKYIGGQPVLGLDIVDKRYVVNEPEGALVRRIFAMLVELESCRKVADALNAEGLVTKRYATKTGEQRGGKAWTSRLVHNVVTDRKYLGEIVHKDQGYPGEHPAIVERGLFDRVRQTLAANRTWTHKHQTERFSLLRRLVVCGHCGSLVQPGWTKNHGREYRYYTCAKKVKTGYDRCPLPTIPAAELENLVIGQLRVILRQPELVVRTWQEVDRLARAEGDEGAKVRLDELRARREQLQQAIRAALSAAGEDDFIAGELKRLQRELRALEREIRKVEQQTGGAPLELDQVAGALQRLDPLWEVLYPEEQRRIVELLVEGVTISVDEVAVRLSTSGLADAAGELGATDGRGAASEKSSPDARPGLEVRPDGGAVVVTIPVEFRERTGRQRVRPLAGDAGPEEANDALVTAIAKAHLWQEQLDAGRYANLDELAAANKATRSYVGRILRLGALAPELVEAIVDGREPSGLSLRKLHREVPTVWEEQSQLNLLSS